MKILISAGEISGDAYGAALLRELRRIVPEPIEAYGIGGDLLRDEGAKLLAHASETGVMGFWEVAKRFRFFSRLLKRLTASLDTRRPDLLLTIDYPGFNLRLAAQAKKRGIKTVHFVCPQVWAWHKNRIPKIAKILDKLICLFPFEPALFDGTGLDAVFLGHPLPELVNCEIAKLRNCEIAGSENQNISQLRNSAIPQFQRIALFPGSRATEISRILPIELEAAVMLEERVGPCEFTIPAPTRKAYDHIHSLLPSIPRKPQHLIITAGNSRKILSQSDAAAIKSGTSTLEACILLCPSVIVYKMNHVSAFIIKKLADTKLKFVGLPNILAQKQVCRELIQSDFTAPALADELQRLLTDTPYRDEMRRSMEEVNASLHGDTAIPRIVAEITNGAVVRSPRQKSSPL
ncbi:MAG: lipid-A-disaccharide synthase [Kiritimatiellaeota bacterium]|nr:lipid-A-disaccharide synthase [Kiritimatiellota bacterium]